MNIYIDESGIFRNPSNEDNIASCVAALAIPSSKRKDVIKDFRRFVAKWKLGDDVKGSKLDETQISEVIQLLKRYDVILDLVVMDLGLLSDKEITDFKLKSADGITANLTPEHRPDLVTQVNELREAFLKMSNQLFVQAVMLNTMIPHLVQNIITYYSRRTPEELGRFHWVVDAKDKSITNYEKAWSTAIYPYIYSQSLKTPLYYVEGGDYSFFDKNMDINLRVSEMTRRNSELREGEIGTFAVKKILGGGFKFQDSKTNLGLQLVDVLVNAAQRALNGKLGESGWDEMGALMINETPQPVQLIMLDINAKVPSSTPTKSPFGTVITKLKRKAKPMFLSYPGVSIRRNKKA